jgi:hypothetical protein
MGPEVFIVDFLFGAVFLKPLFLPIIVFLATSFLRYDVSGTVRAAGPGVEDHQVKAHRAGRVLTALD